MEAVEFTIDVLGKLGCMFIVGVLLAVCFISSTVLVFPLYFHLSWLICNDWVPLLKWKQIAVGEINHIFVERLKKKKQLILEQKSSMAFLLPFYSIVFSS